MGSALGSQKVEIKVRPTGGVCFLLIQVLADPDPPFPHWLSAGAPLPPQDTRIP